MDNTIINNSNKLNSYNLNFVIDNFIVNILNYKVETFNGIDGYDVHKHFCYELHYIKSGSGQVTFNEKTHELVPGDMYLMSPNIAHSQYIYDHHMIEYALRFDIKRLKSSPNPSTIMEESKQIINLLKRSANKIIHQQFALEKLFEESYQEAFGQRPGYYIVLKQYLMRIIIETARSAINDDDKEAIYPLPTRDIDRHNMNTITQFILDNISTKITNKTIASHVYMSERHLYRIIKRQTGLATHQYIAHLRINYVKKLLSQNLYTLKTISEMSGYSSAFHLSSAFKRHTGMTPSSYIDSALDKYQQSIEPYIE